MQLEATSSVTSSLDKNMMKRKNHSHRITILELVQIGKAFQKKSNEAMDTGHCSDRESSPGGLSNLFAICFMAPVWSVAGGRKIDELHFDQLQEKE